VSGTNGYGTPPLDCETDSGQCRHIRWICGHNLARSFFQHCVKNGPKRLQLCSFITKTLLLIEAARVHQFFVDSNFEVVPHAPYSPDVAPSNFWLFPTLKDTLRGRIFSSGSALATAIFQWSQRTRKEAFAAAMQSWRQRCEKCLRLQGDYVEK